MPAPNRCDTPKPPTITSTVASTGSRAAYPGNSVVLVNSTPASTMPARPTHDMHARTPPGIRESSAAPIAINAPRPNSQPRAKVEKYAPTGFTRVSWMQNPSEARNHRAHRDDQEHPTATGSKQRQRQKRWPHDVELLLHRQRPEVLERGWGVVLGEVVGADLGEVDVGGKQRRPDGVMKDRHRPDVVRGSATRRSRSRPE